jgi:hypothetical protein
MSDQTERKEKQNSLAWWWNLLAGKNCQSGGSK